MDDQVSRRRFPLLIAIGVILIVAVILRFYDIGRRDFWFDESCTYIYISRLWHWPEGWRGLLRESTNLPYYVSLWGWSLIFGDSPGALRAMSALAGALAIPVLAMIAYRLRGATAAITCAALTALNPIHVHYSREARAYALWMLTLSVAMWFLIEAVRTNMRRAWIAFGAATYFNLHLHYWTFFWIPASAAVILIAEHPRLVMKRWLTTMGCTLIAFIPYFLLAVIPAARGGGNLWVEPHFDALTAIPSTLWTMLPACAYPAHLRGLSLDSPDTTTHLPAAVTTLAPDVSVIMVIVLVVLVLLRLSDRPKTTPLRPRLVKGEAECEKYSGPRAEFPGAGTHLFVASITIGPLVLALLCSLLVRPNYLVGRYDMVAWPGAMIWMTLLVVDACSLGVALGGEALASPLHKGGQRGVSHDPRTSVRAGSASSRARLGRNETSIASPLTKGGYRGVFVVSIFVLCALVSLERELGGDVRASLAHLRAERIAELTSPGDLVIAFSYDRDYLLYDLHRTGFRGTIRSFPTWLKNQVGWLDTMSDLSAERGNALRESAESLAREAQGVFDRGGRVFILADSIDPSNLGPRAEVNRVLIEKLRVIDCDVTLADERLRILNLACPNGV